ncbi:hypothetical protein EC973_002674 [Apophysomyces ossiformis]|uniref:Uncharacterized protein n=1 Tax=Apophysomyces ossiformis TaxID=679940 RepID=A0A8H7BKC6_9FUNG|nr:hypothetical protein EC973_002674 [Apophysomyces ossiformis]
MYATRAFSPRAIRSFSGRRLYATDGPGSGPTTRGPKNNNNLILGLIAASAVGYYFYRRQRGPSDKMNDAYGQAKQAVQGKVDEVKGATQEKLEQAGSNAESLRKQGMDAVKDKGQEIGDKVKDVSK